MKDRYGKNNPMYKHGMTKTRLYEIWRAMKKRCYLKSHIHYKNYGGKGITICNEWLNDFMNFYNWAMQNGYKENLTIDRINVNGNYEPNNCRWVNTKTQARNKNTNVFIEYKGQTKIMQDWAKEFNIKGNVFRQRYILGWSMDKIKNTPVRSKNGCKRCNSK